MHVLAAVAEFERSVICERINAGLAAARERGTRLGRPRTLDRHLGAVAKLSRRGLSGRKIAAELNIPPGSVFAVLKNVKREPVNEPRLLKFDRAKTGAALISFSIGCLTACSGVAESNAVENAASYARSPSSTSGLELIWFGL